MSRRLLSAAVAAALAIVAFVPGARAEPVGGLRLETLVPDRTLAFASLEDVGSWGERAKETAIGKMLADPEMKAFTEPLVKELEKFAKGEGDDGKKPEKGDDSDEGRGRHGFQIPPVVGKLIEQLKGLKGQVAVALVDVVEGHGPVLAGGFDFGEHVSDFVTFLKRVAAEAEKGGPKITMEEKGGRTWFTLADGERPAAFATSVGSSILVSTDVTWVESVVASEAAPVAGPLSASAAFQAVKAGMGGAGLAMFVHANVPSILERVHLSDETKRVATALGADTVRAAGYGVAFRGDGFLESLVVDAPNADHGLVSLLQMKPGAPKALALAPSTAFYFSEASYGLSTLLPKVRELATRIDARAAKDIDEWLADAKQTIGQDIEADLLSGLADDVAFYMAFPETGGLYPELSVSLAVKDPKTFEATFEKTVSGIVDEIVKKERVSASQRTIEYHGQRLHVVDLSGVRKRQMVPFTPTWAMLGDRLTVSAVPHAMKEIVLRNETGASAGGGLAGQEDVKALLRAAPEGYGGFGYLDLQAAMSLLYDTGVPLLQTLAKPNVLPIPVKLDWDMLPAARTMRPYFRSLGSFVSCDDKGLRVSMSAPIPMVLPMMLAATAVPMLLAKRRHAGMATTSIVASDDVQRMRAEARMRSLEITLGAYVARNGSLPEKLEAMTTADPNSGRPLLAELPKDMWGLDYQYRVLDAKNLSYELLSAGPDRTFGTEDDVRHAATAK